MRLFLRFFVFLAILHAPVVVGAAGPTVPLSVFSSCRDWLVSLAEKLGFTTVRSKTVESAQDSPFEKNLPLKAVIDKLRQLESYQGQDERSLERYHEIELIKIQARGDTATERHAESALKEIRKFKDWLTLDELRKKYAEISEQYKKVRMAPALLWRGYELARAQEERDETYFQNEDESYGGEVPKKAAQSIELLRSTNFSLMNRMGAIDLMLRRTEKNDGREISDFSMSELSQTRALLESLEGQISMAGVSEADFLSRVDPDLGNPTPDEEALIHYQNVIADLMRAHKLALIEAVKHSDADQLRNLLAEKYFSHPEKLKTLQGKTLLEIATDPTIKTLLRQSPH